MKPEYGRNLNIIYVGMLPPHPGGSAISWSQLLARFAAVGHTVRSLAPITEEALQAGDAFAAGNKNISVVRFLVPHYYTGPNVPASEKYRKLEHEQIHDMLPSLIADERPDIIIIGRETFALHVTDIARMESIPCIQGIRGNTTVAILNQTYPEDLAKEMLEQFRKASLLVSAAQHMADGLKNLGFNTIKTIPNAVDLNQFCPKQKSASLLHELGLREDDTTVVHVSNLKTAKRPLDIVNSAERALERDPKLAYVIVGDGANRRAMEDCCLQKRVSERFRFVGWVEYSRIPDYLNLADIVLMPSATEGMSRVYLEAMACARLLLASDIDPAREVIEDGVSGLLFRKGDVKDLSAKTVLAARDPELRYKIGHRARERIKPHSLDHAVRLYLASFELCIKECLGRQSG